MTRGRLRIYLGAAPGVGKTYAMLAEGQRRRKRGTDVVIGFVEPHGRRLTAEMADGLEIVPRRELVHRGRSFTEMDIDAVLERRPQVALVDELAHTNVPGSRNAKRFQDVDELLDACVNVVTTLNIQHLESLADVVEQITGVPQRERLPDSVARQAEQVELVDMAPEALRRRMVHGNVYPADRIEAALTHYFRPGNLTALRELALLWVADRVEEGLQRYRAEHGIAGPWETKERILVALTGEPKDEALIRRATRIAERTPGAEFLAVHVVTGQGLLSGASERLTEQRRLVEALNGSYHEVVGEDVADALLRFARARDATQLVLGAGRRGRWLSLIDGRGVGPRIVRAAGHLDVHLVALDAKTTGRPRRAAGSEHLDAVRAEAFSLIAPAFGALPSAVGLPALLEVVRELLDVDTASVLEKAPEDGGTGQAGHWFVVASTGEGSPEHPEEASFRAPLDENTVIATAGRSLDEADRRALSTCTAPLCAALDRYRSSGSAPAPEGPSGDEPLRLARMRTSLALQRALEAPGTALRALHEDGPPGDRVRLEYAREELEYARHLVADLIDLDRLRAGALETYLRPVDLDEVLAAVVDDLGPGGHELTVSLPDELPDPIADAALLARVLTRLAAHALRHSPPERPPTVDAAAEDGRVTIRVQGATNGAGYGDVGPLLRVSRELVEAMSGLLTTTSRPDGFTVAVVLPSAAPSHRR